MSGPAESPGSDTVLQTTLDENMPYIGLSTRLLSWVIDVVLINLVAIITGLGAQLIASIFPITKNLRPLFVAIGGTVYLPTLDGRLLRRALVDDRPDAWFSPDAGSVGDRERGEVLQRDPAAARRVG
jgi:hypothetical protein